MSQSRNKRYLIIANDNHIYPVVLFKTDEEVMEFADNLYLRDEKNCPRIMHVIETDTNQTRHVGTLP